jgi:tetratricopeptide (TPR) repeat protein
LYADKGDVDRAIANYDQAIKLDPNYAEAYNNRGNAYSHKGDNLRAIADYDQAIKLDPKDALTYSNRGKWYRDKGDSDRAIADFDQAIKLDPKFDNAYYNRALAYHDKRDYHGAIADYSAALQINSKHALAWNNRCVDRTIIGQLQAALADCNEALKIKPNDADHLDSRAVTYLKLGQLDNSIADYDAALRIDPKLAMSLYGRGLAKQFSKIEGSDLDIEAAKKIDPDIAKKFSEYEIPSNGPVAASQLAPEFPAMVARDRRVALVIGNSAYDNLRKISNPRNDADDLAQALRELGFDVVLGTDLKRAEMEEALIQFSRTARQADTALVYYAGHGIQHNGVNYLIPVDAQVGDEADLVKLVSLQSVIANLQGASHVRLLIVDACRDNEAVQQLASRLPAARAAGFTRGLARIDGADGTLVAFATQPNRVAADGIGRNSPFAQALLKHLPTPGLELRTLMARVRAEVVTATGGAQRPEVWDSLVGEFAFKAGQ